MSDQIQHGMACGEFETLLTDALDDALDGAKMQAFRAHAATCASCGPMFAEAETGMNYLRVLEEVEPPVHLVHNILAATTEKDKPAVAAEPERRGLWQRLRGAFQPVFAPVMQPRFATTFGMAFFSVTLLLNLAGVRMSDLKSVDLRPSAIRRTATLQIYETQARVMKYYDNIRLVYEVESRVRALKNATSGPAAPAKSDDSKKPADDNTSGQPDKQNQNYSREQHEVLQAVLNEVDPNGTHEA